MPDKTTTYRKADQALLGKFPESPAISAWFGPRNCTEGTVQTVTRAGVGESDTCTVLFRGKVVAATCAHPGITAGATVSMIEQPQGCFWATQDQNSWYRRPLLELIQKGKPATAALEYILSKGRTWKPEVVVTLNSAGWSVKITSSPLFPTYVFFQQTIDGVNRPSALTGDIAERLALLVPGYHGENPAPVSDDGGDPVRTYTGDPAGTLVSFIIIPFRYVSHHTETGVTIEWFPSEAYVDAFAWDAVRVSVNGGAEMIPTFSARDIGIYPPDPGEIATVSSCEYAEYAM